MQVSTFKDMYIAELQELVSVEQQLGNAPLRMADIATHSSLSAILGQHQPETIMHGELCGPFCKNTA